MSTPRFVHLHVHTEFSMVDSTIRVPAKPDQADPKDLFAVIADGE